MRNGAGLYIHIPFCAVKCFYCDFAAVSGQKGQAERYLAALEAEASLAPPMAPETLYIGGGTPSELSVGQISDLFGVLGRAYPSARFEEATFEANPESLDEAKLDVVAAAGITRLSIGLQTCDDGLLRAIGRRHTAADFIRVFRRARSAGLPAISIDLMYGLPGQTLDGLRETLASVLALAPEHVSLYGLQIEARTMLAKRGVREDSALGRRMYELAISTLAEAGLEHYEISNFARPGRRSRHNINYWRRGEYIGLGCSAASFLAGTRSSNEWRLESYLKSVEEGRRPVSESERPEGLESLGEQAFLGLRLIEGFKPTDALRSAFAGPWAVLKARGLVCEDGPRWRLTAEGVFFANDVLREFVPPFQLEEATA